MKIENLNVGDRVLLEYGFTREHAKIQEIADKVVLQLSDNRIEEFDVKHITKVFKQ